MSDRALDGLDAARRVGWAKAISRGTLLVRALTVLVVADAMHRVGDHDAATSITMAFLASLDGDREGGPALLEARDTLRRWLEDD